MTAPWAILLVPAEAGAGLLEVGPRLRLDCPSDLDIIVSRCGHPPRIVFHGRHPDALPLWWDGALVEEGWDRFRRWALGRTEEDGSEGRDFCTAMWCQARDASMAAEWAAESVGGFRVILLDLVDGRLVERA